MSLISARILLFTKSIKMTLMFSGPEVQKATVTFADVGGNEKSLTVIKFHTCFVVLSS